MECISYYNSCLGVVGIESNLNLSLEEDRGFNDPLGVVIVVLAR